MRKSLQMMLVVLMMLIFQGQSFAQEAPIVKLGDDLLKGGLVWNEKSYVPLRAVLTRLGYTVNYDAAKNQVSAVKPEKTIHLLIREPKQIYVNDVLLHNSEILPIVKDGTTYIPAQFIPWIEKSVQKTVGNMIQIIKEDQEIYISIEPEQLKGKIAYLTFDDGPSGITARILDILKKYDVPATFFVIGRNIKGNEDILKRTAEEGHMIGNHTYSHNYDTIYKNKESFIADVEKGKSVLEKTIGQKPTIFRFPGGSNNSVSKKAQDPAAYGPKWIMPDLVKEVEKRGYAYFDWNVSTGDASGSSYTAESAYQKVKNGIAGKREAIILSHDTASKSETVKALPRIIELLKAEGYSFKTLTKDSKEVSFLK